MTQMKIDADFMAWLAKYLPDWESEYSGSLLGLHDAFNAGRAEAKRGLVDPLTNMIDENIRKQRCGTYDEWQSAVQSLLNTEVSRGT